MNVINFEKKMENSLWNAFNIHLSDLTIFEFGNTLNEPMIFVENYYQDFYYYYPEDNRWIINESWTYFKNDKTINEIQMKITFKQIFKKSYNDLIYIGNWSCSKKYSRSNYYHFRHIDGVEYLYERFIGIWTVKLPKKDKDSDRCCCIIS